jgi:hypothetical protein
MENRTTSRRPVLLSENFTWSKRTKKTAEKTPLVKMKFKRARNIKTCPINTWRGRDGVARCK